MTSAVAAPLAWSAAYALTIVSTLAAWRRDRAWPWLVIAGLLLATGTTRVLGWQEALTGMERAAAQHEGWYPHRRGPQAATVILLTTAGILATAGALQVRSLPMHQRFAIAATLLLLCLTAVRMVSLHHVDRILVAGIGPVRVGRTLEAADLAAIAACAHGTRRGVPGHLMERAKPRA